MQMADAEMDDEQRAVYGNLHKTMRGNEKGHDQDEETPGFVYNDRLTNVHEKEFGVEMTPAGLRQIIDQWCAQGVENDEGNWVNRKDAELVRVWTKWEGSEYNQSIPVIKAIHYFPDIEDPIIIKRAFIDFRTEWDYQIETNIELTEFTNKNMEVRYIKNKTVANTQQRDFIDKKIWFTTSEASGTAVNEEDDEIYVYVTSAPNELYAIDDRYMRGDTLFGYNRIGRRKDGKPGCYIHCNSQTDVKINPWFNLVLQKIVAGQMTEWGINFRKYCAENKEKLLRGK